MQWLVTVAAPARLSTGKCKTLPAQRFLLPLKRAHPHAPRTTPATRWRTRASRLRATPMQHNRRASSSAPTHSSAPSISRVPLSVRRSDAVDARLRSGVPALAPHEWKGGEPAWLIDVISPFEKAEGYVAACCGKFMAGKKVSRLVAGKESVRVEEVVGVAG